LGDICSKGQLNSHLLLMQIRTDFQQTLCLPNTSRILCDSVSEAKLPCKATSQHACAHNLNYAVRAGLCPWDNPGKENSWRPPPIHKNLQKKKCEALQYCDNNEFIQLTVGTLRVLMSKAATNSMCSNKQSIT
jgi:hypothetical protein